MSINQKLIFLIAVMFHLNSIAQDQAPTDLLFDLPPDPQATESTSFEAPKLDENKKEMPQPNTATQKAPPANIETPPANIETPTTQTSTTKPTPITNTAPSEVAQKPMVPETNANQTAATDKQIPPPQGEKEKNPEPQEKKNTPDEVIKVLQEKYGLTLDQINNSNLKLTELAVLAEISKQANKGINDILAMKVQNKSISDIAGELNISRLNVEAGLKANGLNLFKKKTIVRPPPHPIELTKEEVEDISNAINSKKSDIEKIKTEAITEGPKH